MTFDEFGNKVNSKHLKVRHSDIFGNTAIVSISSTAEADAAKAVALAIQKKLEADKRIEAVKAKQAAREAAAAAAVVSTPIEVDPFVVVFAHGEAAALVVARGEAVAVPMTP